MDGGIGVPFEPPLPWYADTKIGEGEIKKKGGGCVRVRNESLQKEHNAGWDFKETGHNSKKALRHNKIGHTAR